MRPRPPTAPAPRGGSAGGGGSTHDDLYMPSATTTSRNGLSTSHGGRGKTSREMMFSSPTWSSNRGSPKNTINRASLVSLPELRDVRNSNKELLGQIKAMAREPRSDVVTEETVREKERACVSLRASYNNWRGRGLAREKHVEKLRAEWEAYSSTKASVPSSTEFFSSDVDASVTMRGVPSVSDVRSTLGGLGGGGGGGAAGAGGGASGHTKSLEKMNPIELRAAMEEAARRLESVELELSMAKQTRAMLDHMVKRFKDERLGEETKYAEIKRSVEHIVRQEKQHVFQVKIVGHDEDVARTKIAALQAKLSKVAAKRRNLVTEEKGKMTIKAELEDYVKGRGVGRKSIVDNVAGDLSLDQEEALKTTASLSNARQATTAMDLAYADRLERAFQVIAERTGDDDINAFVTRFLTLVEIGKHADSGKEAMEENAAELRRTLDTVQNQLTELQDAGMSISIRRNEFNDLEDEISAKEKMEAHFTASSDAVHYRLSHLRVGVTAFSDKLELVASKLPSDNSTSSVSSKAQAPPQGSSSDDSEDPTVRQLHFIDSCIERMLASLEASGGGGGGGVGGNTTMKSKQQQGSRMASLAASLEEEDDEEEEDSEDELDMGTMRADFEYNLRVKGSTMEGSTTVDPNDPLFYDYDYPDDDDDAPPGIVPLDEGHFSVGGLAREAKSAVMKHARREERRRVRQAEEAAGKSSLKVKVHSSSNDKKKEPGSSKKRTSSSSKKASGSLSGGSRVRGKR